MNQNQNNRGSIVEKNHQNLDNAAYNDKNENNCRKRKRNCSTIIARNYDHQVIIRLSSHIYAIALSLLTFNK